MEIRGVNVHVTSTLSFSTRILDFFLFFLFELRGLPRIRPSGMNSSQGAIQMYCNYMASSRQQKKKPLQFSLYFFIYSLRSYDCGSMVCAPVRTSSFFFLSVFQRGSFKVNHRHHSVSLEMPACLTITQNKIYKNSSF